MKTQTRNRWQVIQQGGKPVYRLRVENPGEGWTRDVREVVALIDALGGLWCCRFVADGETVHALTFAASSVNGAKRRAARIATGL